jgi:hypothetical protein
MKNKIIALFLVAFAFASCESYLDRAPMDSNSDATNWSSESALEIYAWSLYANFEGYGSGWTRGQYLSEAMSDDYVQDSYAKPTESAPSANSAWSNPYEEIRRANILLSRVDQVPGLSEASANHWKGVAKFFRAQQYFKLVTTFGDCVWVDAEVDIDDSEALNQPRTDRVTVMKNVCTDLQFAAENCRYTTNNTVNNMAAYALLSRVALFEAAWQKYHANNSAEATYFYGVAKSAASEIIKSGNYSIHNDYTSNYISKSLSGNTEMIMYKVYDHTGEGGKVTHAHAMQGWSSSSSKSWGLTKSAVENFANANGLPIHMGVYNDETIEAIFANRDARLSLICDPEIFCTVGFAYTEGVNSSTGYYTDKLVDWNDYGTPTWSAPANTADAPIYTLSEVMLNYAEACAEIEDLGGAAMSQNDLDISVNELRVKHGNMPALTYAGKGKVSVNGVEITADPKNVEGISNLLWEIRRERRSELMCDGFRYEDLLRWKQGYLLDFSKNPDGYRGVSRAALEAYVEAHKDEDLHKGQSMATIDANNSFDDKYLIGFDVTVNNRKFDENKNYLEPIPSTQITLHPALGQNPGW